MQRLWPETFVEENSLTFNIHLGKDNLVQVRTRLGADLARIIREGADFAPGTV
jgi:DNA-binding winged helix-turn-helix (wHTH) protein